MHPYTYALEIGTKELVHGDFKHAIRHLVMPVSYWRLVEFQLVRDACRFVPEDRILDIGSPRSGDPYAEIEKLVPYAVSWQIKENVGRDGKDEPTDLAKIKAIILGLLTAIPTPLPELLYIPAGIVGLVRGFWRKNPTPSF